MASFSILATVPVRKALFKVFTLLLTSSVFLVTIFKKPTDNEYKLSYWHNTARATNESITCQENVYRFPSSSISIFNDTDLIGQCKDQLTSAEGQVVASRMEAFPPEGQPMSDFHIRTKCFYENPKLLSFYRTPPRPERDGHKVPNLVHYIWFRSEVKFRYINYLSFFSANKFLKPSRIILHGDSLPDGSWWKKMLQEIPNVYFISHVRPVLIQGITPRYVEHEADILRLQILYANGGIYLDMDVLVLRSFNPLRNYEATLGEERDRHYSNGIILAQRHSPFICVWLHAYREYQRSGDWDTFSTIYPFLLAKTIPEHIHIEETNLIKPGFYEARKKMFFGFMDWSNNYAIHVWHRTAIAASLIPQTPTDLQKVHNTLMEVINYILKAGT